MFSVIGSSKYLGARKGGVGVAPKCPSEVSSCLTPAPLHCQAVSRGEVVSAAVGAVAAPTCVS